MSDMQVTTVKLDPTSVAQATAEQRRTMLRKAVNELVGTTFFAPMLKMAHNSVIQGKYGHGGHGEQVFQGQLDLELARRAGQGMKSSLSDAIFNHYLK